MAVPNDPVTWGFAAIVAGTVLWMALQHCDRFGVRDTVLRAVVIVLIGTGTFTVGLETAQNAYPFHRTAQSAGGTQAFLD